MEDVGAAEDASEALKNGGNAQVQANGQQNTEAHSYTKLIAINGSFKRTEIDAWRAKNENQQRPSSTSTQPSTTPISARFAQINTPHRLDSVSNGSNGGTAARRGQDLAYIGSWTGTP